MPRHAQLFTLLALGSIASGQTITVNTASDVVDFVGQQKVVSDIEQRVELARAAWQTCEQKKMSFVTLAERANKEQSRRELWRDQKQNDEHAARRSPHKRTPS